MRAAWTAPRRCSRRPRARTPRAGDGRVIDEGDTPTICSCCAHAACESTPTSSTRTSARSSTRERHPFVARNDAGWTGGAFVHVPRGVTRRGADRADRDLRRGRPLAPHWRAADRARGGRRGRGLGAADPRPADAATLVNGVVELGVGQNATAALRRRPGHRRGDPGSSAPSAPRSPATATSTGSRSASARPTARSARRRSSRARGCARQVTGAYAARGRQHTRLRHARRSTPRPNTTVRPRLPRHPRRPLAAVWRGMIKVDPGAQQTDAFQECRNLLLVQARARRRDPRPGDPGQRRALHPRRGDRPDRPRAALLPELARPRASADAQRLVIEGFMAELVERFEGARSARRCRAPSSAAWRSCSTDPGSGH